MAASAKILTSDNRTQNGEWTFVLPRRGKTRRNLPKLKTPGEQLQPWVPTDDEIDLDRELKLKQRMENCIKRMESSNFCQTFLKQMQSQEILDFFHNVLGSETKMPMVIYGIGSIESYETARFQLSLAILMKRKFSWISDVEVFDPILSLAESQVLQAFGCSVLSVNEQGRRHVVKPTLFYLPHCEAELYDSLLNANWRAEDLNRMVLFGNSFETYKDNADFLKNNSTVNRLGKHVLAAQKFTSEHKIDRVSDRYFNAFHDSSWHFFRPDLKSKLPSVRD